MSTSELPRDLEGVTMKAGDCYRGEMWVAEIYTIGYDPDFRNYVVSYGIVGTIACGACSLAAFLERFPYRVELRPKDEVPRPDKEGGVNAQIEESGALTIPEGTYRGIHGSAECTVLSAGTFDPEEIESRVVVRCSGSGAIHCWQEATFLERFAPGNR